MLYLIYILCGFAIFGVFLAFIFYFSDDSSSAKMNRMIEEREKQRRKEVERAVRRAKERDKNIRRRKGLKV